MHIIIPCYPFIQPCIDFCAGKCAHRKRKEELNDRNIIALQPSISIHQWIVLKWTLFDSAMPKAVRPGWQLIWILGLQPGEFSCVAVRKDRCGIRRGLSVADRASVISLRPGKASRARIEGSVERRNAHEKGSKYELRTMGPKVWRVLGKPSGLKPGFTIAASIYPKLCLLKSSNLPVVSPLWALELHSEPSCDPFHVYGAICSA